MAMSKKQERRNRRAIPTLLRVSGGAKLRPHRLTDLSRNDRGSERATEPATFQFSFALCRWRGRVSPSPVSSLSLSVSSSV